MITLSWFFSGCWEKIENFFTVFNAHGKIGLFLIYFSLLSFKSGMQTSHLSAKFAVLKTKLTTCVIGGDPLRKTVGQPWSRCGAC